MLTLITFPGSFGAPSHSPYCVKAMCLLQLSGFEWQPKYLNDPRPMPLSRLPVLRDSETLIPDSAQIQAHLEGKGADFYRGLSDQDKARAHALVQMTEMGLYNILVHDRWLVDECWTHTREAFFHVIPFIVRGQLTRKLRKNIRNKMIAQGTAQFTESERLEQMARDLNALAMQLGDQDFLFGEVPTAADAAIAPVLDMILNLPAKTGARDLLRGWDGLPAYVGRVRDQLYPTP
ncbi:glutathione S-transferase family protein [Planktotalea sp.]|uniref:glutathione S-transferase family protein n=1 Tax=Planktotalea sp. TaxID=2029877 RepID=UPI003D6AC0F9